ncbi:MAG TPA: UDP-N-acetylmuramoyl-L-alanyl-D-glutamate--2,6-diaminopimelate ligase [Agitococcus sp.]|nr:UDP-N-acetylmuramoyl-L-alanyl-D-glutamate--2,6-diaminopimelate ligase [Agitococcus sp.]
MTQLIDIWPAISPEYAHIEMTGMSANSRDIKQGEVFIALQGQQHDARKFIPQAIAQGAVAVLCQTDSDTQLHGAIPVIAIKDLPQQLGAIAARFYGHASQDLTVLAVTGTNGKTSCAQLLAHACSFLGKKSAVLGTLGNGLVGELVPSTHTTLDALQLQQKLAEFKQAGAQVVALEASSHGLEQGRLLATCIDTAIFTNLSRDHLDYHGTMQDYQQAKALLFAWPTLKTAILNADDPVAVAYQQQLKPSVRCWRYSQDANCDADFVALEVTPSLQGLVVKVKTPQGIVTIHSQLLGRFNVSNLLAVLAGLLSIDVSLTEAVTALNHVQAVKGRMQCLSNGNITAVVDYAHTPDALEKVLHSLREHTQGQLWCVFGCGGDRDKGKRPLMGEIASRLADKVVVTADNPRSEPVSQILEQIVKGVTLNNNTYWVMADRKQAIHYALASAQTGDMVLIAGKGHEDYQEIHGVRYPFDDAAIVQHFLEKNS